MIPAHQAAREGWRSRTTFVLALSSSAVGLGNLWRFSYLTGENGGAPFVVSYLVCLFLVAVPLMVAEVVIGSQGRAGPISSTRRASDRSLRSRGWTLIGLLACLTGLLILSYYSVVAGWALAYSGFMQSGQFASASAASVGAQFDSFINDPAQQFYWHSLFVLLSAIFVALGVRRGLGMLVWFAVPALLAMLGVLVRFGLENGDVAAAGDFLFSVNPLDFSWHSLLVALGHAFFTLGVGVGTGISYGAYAPGRIPIGRSIIAVAVFDAMIALLAGLAIFPVVFASNMEPTMGPGLMFVSVPYAFGNIIQGELFGSVFFMLVVVAALGSAVAMMEPIVASLREAARIGRIAATLLVALAVWLAGLAVVMSLSSAQQAGRVGQTSLFAVLDSVSADILLPLVCLLTAIFVGWRMRPELLRLELGRESRIFFSLWRLLLRYIAPPAIVLVMLAGLSVIGA